MMVDLELDLDFENVCVIFFSIANQSLDHLELDLDFENVCVCFSQQQIRALMTLNLTWTLKTFV